MDTVTVLKASTEVTLATVERDGLALQFSGPKLRKKKDLVLAAKGDDAGGGGKECRDETGER